MPHKRPQPLNARCPMLLSSCGSRTFSMPDGMAKLRTVYPNLMQLVYDNSRTRQSRQVEVTEHVEQKSEMELFEEFYEIQNNQPMSEEQQDFVRELMEELVH